MFLAVVNGHLGGHDLSQRTPKSMKDNDSTVEKKAAAMHVRCHANVFACFQAGMFHFVVFLEFSSMICLVTLFLLAVNVRSKLVLSTIYFRCSCYFRFLFVS